MMFIVIAARNLRNSNESYESVPQSFKSAKTITESNIFCRWKKRSAELERDCKFGFEENIVYCTHCGFV